MKKQLVIIKGLLGVILLSGCGSTQQKADSVVFTKNITGKTYEQSKSLWSSCQTNKKIVEKASWKQLMKFANTCAVKKKWSEVEHLGYTIVEKEPNSPWGLYYLSLAAEANGKNRKALWMVDMALKKAPQSGTINYHKARLLWKENEYELSLNQMEKAVEYDPELVTAHLFLGQVKLRDQEYKSAKNHFSKVLVKDSSNYYALLGVADSMNHLNEFNSAAPYYEKAIDERPKELEPRLQLAYLYENHLKSPEKALEQYTWISKKVSASQLKKHVNVNIQQKITNLKKTIVEKDVAQRTISSQTTNNKAVK